MSRPIVGAEFELVEAPQEADEALIDGNFSSPRYRRAQPCWKRKRFLVPAGTLLVVGIISAIAVWASRYGGDDWMDPDTDDPAMNPLPKNYNTAVQQHVIDQFGHIVVKWKPNKPPLPDQVAMPVAEPISIQQLAKQLGVNESTLVQSLPTFPHISRLPSGVDYSYGKGAPGADDVIVIDCFFFVIVDEDGKTGNLPNRVLQAQVDRMNLDWRDAPFQFRLAGVQRWQSGFYFHNTYHDTREDAKMKEKAKEMKAKFRPSEGGPHQLFLYTCNLGRGLNGFSTWPWDYEDEPEYDGLVLHYETLPGVSEMTGNTASHEAGHWMGLFHTFKGGCLEPGDYVNDTKPEMKNNNDNPDCLPRNTCPRIGPQPDPIFNLMDYGICRQEFTPGQATRMVQFWNACRSGSKNASCKKPS